MNNISFGSESHSSASQPRQPPTAVSGSSYNIKTRAVVEYKSPVTFKVDKGKTYYWCVCGWSKNQPFCDGSHLEANDTTGSEWQPIPWTAEVDGEEKWFCRCKQTKTPPFCDGSHTLLWTEADIKQKQEDDAKMEEVVNGILTEEERRGLDEAALAEANRKRRVDGLVQSTWNSLITRFNLRELGKMFYEELFALDPTLRVSLFQGVDMAKQAERIIEMWGTSIKLLKHDSGKAVLAKLGYRHVPYGVKSEHFPLVGRALMSLLTKTAVNWNDEKNDAWLYVFEEIRRPMLGGLYDAGGEVPEDIIEYHKQASRNNQASYDIKTRAKVAAKGPIGVTVVKGKAYYWCTCGHSKTQPFCDGSHTAVNDEHGSSWEPQVWIAPEDDRVMLCQCKQTKTPPFCDGVSHQICE